MRNPKEHAPLAEALRHPLRVAILVVLNERDLSPTEFIDAGYADFYFGHSPAVSHVAYHFRELRDFGCIEAVDWRRRRGSVETVYRGLGRVDMASDPGRPDVEERSASRAVSQALIARVDSAMAAETFDSREDRRLSWRSLRLDEEGWSEAATVLTEAYVAVERIHLESESRRGGSEEEIAATVGILLFESPDLRPPAEIGGDED